MLTGFAWSLRGNAFCMRGPYSECLNSQSKWLNNTHCQVTMDGSNIAKVPTEVVWCFSRRLSDI